MCESAMLLESALFIKSHSAQKSQRLNSQGVKWLFHNVFGCALTNIFFCISIGSKEAQFYTLRTAKSLAMTALDVIFKPDLLKSVREDWEREKELEEAKNVISPENARESSGGAACASC